MAKRTFQVQNPDTPARVAARKMLADINASLPPREPVRALTDDEIEELHRDDYSEFDSDE